MPETAPFLGRRGVERGETESRVRNLPSELRARGTEWLRSLPQDSNNPAQEKREVGRFPQQRRVREKQGARVTILACHSNFILSFLFSTRTLHGAPCFQASEASLWPGSGCPRFPRALLSHRPPRATRSQRSGASEQASSPGARGRRLLPTAP